MTARYGIDTSILVRLTAGEPARDFEETAAALTRLVETEHVVLFASNMVIGEAYVAIQHHFGVGKTDAKAALRSVLTSGLVAPVAEGLTRSPQQFSLAARSPAGIVENVDASGVWVRFDEALTRAT